MDNVFDSIYYNRGKYIGGIDESGVTDIAGPLVAACVVLPQIQVSQDMDLRIFQINDSKVVPERLRPKYAEIIWQTALAIGVGEVTPNEIDYYGIVNAIKMSHLRAIAACQFTDAGNKCFPEFLMIDGNDKQIKLDIDTPFIQIGEGDEKSLSIACASIVAKVYRDGVMNKLHKEYPFYKWNKNKGQRCDDHFSGMDHHGIVVGVHRLRNPSFLQTSPERIAMWKDMTIKRTLSTLKQLS